MKNYQKKKQKKKENIIFFIVYFTFATWKLKTSIFSGPSFSKKSCVLLYFTVTVDAFNVWQIEKLKNTTSNGRKSFFKDQKTL